MEVTIVGAGIGGLTLSLMLHKAGIASRIFEATPEVRALGVGVNLLPHATKELAALGLEEALSRVAITTREQAYYNRFGQFIYSEPSGRYGGYSWPQFSIHRADLHKVLLDAFVERVGSDRLHLGMKCLGFREVAGAVELKFENQAAGNQVSLLPCDIVVACDGIHSAVRKALYPEEGPPRYSGINMWRGVTRAKPYLTGASMVRIGWLTSAKVLIYPIRDHIDSEGRQLINWVVDIGTEHYLKQRDWNREGRLEDFIAAVEDWHFDWLDVPALFRAAESILEYPMVDQDPLTRWSFGPLTLLGDAAHPMYPRGANGSAQAILDCRSLVAHLVKERDPVVAFKKYEAERLPVTARVVLTNRKDPPDAILREVHVRSGDKPFKSIDELISHDELAALSKRYHQVSGSDKETVGAAH